MAKKATARSKKSRDGSTVENEPTINFETAMAEIESIVGELESGELDLTNSLVQYERGIARLRQCHQTLESAEQKISLLAGFDADGNPVTEIMPETQFRGSSPAVSLGVSGIPKGGGASGSDGGSDAGQADAGGSVDDSVGLF